MSLEHWAWLGIAAQPGNKIVDDILRVFPDPEEFFLSGDLGIEKVGTINSKDALRIRATSLDVAKRAVETAENYGAKVLTKESEFYPRNLLSIESAPPVLYVLGDETCLNQEPAVAVVGTRRISEYGNKMAKIIAGGLGSAGALVVSGMSLGVCVVEAAARSGTSITANLAFDQGRKVFAVPADVNRTTSQGTFRLLRSGAIPVADAKEILMEFGEEYTGEQNRF